MNIKKTFSQIKQVFIAPDYSNTEVYVQPLTGDDKELTIPLAKYEEECIILDRGLSHE